MAAEIFTAGHSTRSIEDFIELLRENHVSRLADVRSYPSSKRHPQFDQQALRDSLAEHGIHYLHLPALGGMRKAGLKDSPNTGWESAGFQHYADHMQSAEFKEGIDVLLETAELGPAAVMCAEANPYRCHRRLISDYLTAVKKIPVQHILSAGRVEPHQLTPFARVEVGVITYPPRQNSLF